VGCFQKLSEQQSDVPQSVISFPLEHWAEPSHRASSRSDTGRQ